MSKERQPTPDYIKEKYKTPPSGTKDKITEKRRKQNKRIAKKDIMKN